jgi:hypothetical protein
MANYSHAHLSSTAIHVPAAKVALAINMKSAIPSGTVARVALAVASDARTVHKGDVVVEDVVTGAVLVLEDVTTLATDEVGGLGDLVDYAAVVAAAIVRSNEFLAEGRSSGNPHHLGLVAIPCSPDELVNSGEEKGGVGR